ncbi:hypothetical protein CS022_21920 [Veronia nyctiphanis]|uniref:Purine nucleoside phosphorylase n=1 Tax=Veronia nyctiphanis TaxID=1278244 RepID=A0A4Q0YK20_9GAMM|nr:peptidoglycan editing factor PgeF [Veronia nyctiphanis]RXJ71062.1 hypothetical protein CS022_21920 [Veronia nyctiphanis]
MDRAQWPAPSTVNAISTTRSGGVSTSPYDSLNLGVHVDDNQRDVETNRQRLIDQASLPSSPYWLNQVHGTRVVSLPEEGEGTLDADAAFTRAENHVCAIMTADCLPVLFCNASGSKVAAAHAGWRGLLNGVLENTLSYFDGADSVMAWLGPAIGPDAFEVGPEVRKQFIAHASEAESAFQPSGDKYFADIYALAKQRLTAAGISSVFGGDWCTYRQQTDFFSYRRDRQTGRQASLIWISSS